jgi:hypothetical protein
VSTPGKAFDPSTVTRATWIALGGSLVLFISVFLSWYSASAKLGGVVNVSGSESGWSSGSAAKLVALLALIAIAALVVELFVPTVTLPVPSSMILIGAGGLSVLLVLIKFLDKPSDGGGIISVSLAYGIFIALIAAVVTTVGGYLKMQEA